MEVYYASKGLLEITTWDHHLLNFQSHIQRAQLLPEANISILLSSNTRARMAIDNHWQQSGALTIARSRFKVVSHGVHVVVQWAEWSRGKGKGSRKGHENTKVGIKTTDCSSSSSKMKRWRGTPMNTQIARVIYIMESNSDMVFTTQPHLTECSVMV